MNTLKKVGLTALGTSLIATSAFAGSMDVTGGASITFAGQDQGTSGNGFTMNDEINFTGSGEMDNGWNVTVKMQLDDNADGDTAEDNLDNRSIAIDMGDTGTLTFSGHGGDSALGAVDDVMPHADGNETWDVLSTATAKVKLGSISGNSQENMFSYTNNSVDGISLTASLVPSSTNNTESTMSYAVAYTGVDGLTVGAAIDENGAVGATQVDYSTMYVKYAYGPVTVGYQQSEEDSSTTGSNDEFTAAGISYAVSDDLTVSYNVSEYNDTAVTTNDQENSAVAVSYTMGSMSLTGTMVTNDNIGGSTANADDVQGYELGVSFAF